MADKTKVITLEELKQHKDEKSLWIAVYDNVYDITKFAAEVNVFVTLVRCRTFLNEALAPSRHRRVVRSVLTTPKIRYSHSV